MAPVFSTRNTLVIAHNMQLHVRHAVPIAYIHDFQLEGLCNAAVVFSATLLVHNANVSHLTALHCCHSGASHHVLPPLCPMGGRYDRTNGT